MTAFVGENVRYFSTESIRNALKCSPDATRRMFLKSMKAGQQQHPADAGAVRVFQPRFTSDFPRTLSAHDIGLRDLLESAQLLGPLPRLFLVAGSIDSIQSMQMELSLPVAAALSTIKHEVDRILAGL